MRTSKFLVTFIALAASLSACAALSLVAAVPALAAPEKEKPFKMERLPFGYVRSGGAINSGFKSTATSLRMEAERENEFGHHDLAIHLCKAALKEDPEDMDVHMCYAESLEGKLRKQKKGQKDPELFMAAVRQWLIVLRGERGEEKGMTTQSGIGLPGITARFKDDDRAMPAKNHLMSLVGYTPAWYESDVKYMKKIEASIERNVNAERIDPEKADKGAKANEHVDGTIMMKTPN